MLNIIIKATELDLTPAIKEYIEEKIGSVQKFLPTNDATTEVQARVEIARTTKHHNKGLVYKAEVNLHVGSMLFRAEQEDVDVRLAIDEVRGKLQREIKKFVGKNRTQDSRGNKLIRETLREK